MRPTRARAIVIALGWLISAGGLWAGDAASRMPLDRTIPGPGPNRLDQATTEPYRVGIGDRLKVAFTFAPTRLIPNQTVRPGDVLAVAYHFKNPYQNPDYKISPGDRVSLHFRYSPLLSQSFYYQDDDKLAVLSGAYTVQPSGDLVLPSLENPVAVAGKTTQEITPTIAALYEGQLTKTDLVVGVTPMNLAHIALQKLFQPDNAEPVLYELPVPEDGKLSLPLVRGVPVAGKTVEAISEDLSDRYHALGYDLVTISVWFKKIADPRHRQLTGLLSGRNNPLGCEILKTGHLTLPLIADFPAVGKSVAQLGAELSVRYRAEGLKRTEVTVWVEEPRSRVLRVMGAVAVPGVYPIRGSADLWGTIALAGGFASEADRSAVTILGPKSSPPRGPFDFNQFIQTGDPETNPMLEGDELIFVPAKPKP
jgi:protein involved in polysaccharide export with SLBB domain